MNGFAPNDTASGFAQSLSQSFWRYAQEQPAFDQAEEIARHYQELLGEIAKRGLDAEVSLKLTQLGFDIDPKRTFGLVDDLARRAASSAS